MNIIYCCPFDTSIPTGKNRATRHKIEALKKISKRIDIIVPNEKEKRLPRALRGFFCEFRCIITVIKNRNLANLYISRGDVGIISVPLARYFKISTMREVHAGPFEELNLIKKSKITKCFLNIMWRINFITTKMADIRIYNNPLLKKNFVNEGWGKESDIVSYNGASLDAISSIDKNTALKKYSLRKDVKYLVFVGSTSKWRGVELLVDLQEEFDKCSDNIKILCGGGEVADDVDPSGKIFNFSPLDDVGCSELIKCADACLLPVAHNRVSPGSPLKLYDYMINGKPVIAQEKAFGYSDEVERFNVGISVDFYSPQEARNKIVALLTNETLLDRYSQNAKASLANYSWESRLKNWLHDESVTGTYEHTT
ncbi:glycosyltransferase [Halomonas sp. M20]|uniref:glycosyltransferase n=1 Tax=Halomonas sp. M20 TaxID=2763264 RepID=UPI001D0AAD61|nr:glycosyltransferase [Halomonas sp. M20]